MSGIEDRLAAVEARLDQMAQAGPRPDSGCPAGFPACNRFGISEEHHAWLLSLEDRGVGGVAVLLAHLEIQEAREGMEGGLHWIDLPEFVSEHNWRSPAAVSALAAHFDGYFRARHPANQRTA